MAAPEYIVDLMNAIEQHVGRQLEGDRNTRQDGG
jgi:hypothetical protein